MTLEQLLLSFGINIASSIVYDFLKRNSNIGVQELSKKLASLLNVSDMEVSGKIIDFLAKNGDICIVGTKIYADRKISLQSGQNTTIVFGNNSSSVTRNGTGIYAGQGSFITMSGGSTIIQGEDGSINFCA